MGSHIVFLNNVFYHEQNLITVFFLEKAKLNNIVGCHYNHRYVFNYVCLETDKFGSEFMECYQFFVASANMGNALC